MLQAFSLSKSPSESKTITYFAFGSNMDSEQLTSRVGPIERYHSARLRGYILVFNKYSLNRKCGAANIIKTNNDSDYIEGVIFYLKPSQIKELDICEGYRRKNGSLSKNPHGYKLKTLTLENGDSAITYIADVHKAKGQPERLKRRYGIDLSSEDLRPTYDYVSHLLKAYKDGLISAQYYDQLLQTPIQEAKTVAHYIDANKQEAKPTIL